MGNNKKLIITLIAIIIILTVALVGAIIYIIMDKDNTSTNDIAVKTTNHNEDDGEKEEDYDTEDISSAAVQVFNEQFQVYEGTECSATSVRNLLSTITASNSTSENYVVLNSSGITESTQVDSTKTYSVELSYDDNGYVDEITILEETSSTEERAEEIVDDMEKAIFNAQFTSYLGKITGEQLLALLPIIQQSNSTNPEHQISLTTNNLQDLNGIVVTDMYVITLSYDDNGYVNTINIDKE